MTKSGKKKPPQEEKLGVDVILNDLSENPQCQHGPTILFEKFTLEGSEKYYACSACRDRKLCSFYLNYNVYQKKGQKSSPQSLFTWEYHVCHYAKLADVKNAEDLDYSFCLTCSKFIQDSERNDHKKCSITEKIAKKPLTMPSRILSPNSNPKYEAQYLFKENSIRTLVNLIKGLSVKKVLCVGTPRIHEFIINESPGLKSFLLDIDHRMWEWLSNIEENACGEYRLCIIALMHLAAQPIYELFFPMDQFAVYNLFNHHFFGGLQSENIFEEFITGSEKILVITDPPFGGRMELIASTMKTIEHRWRKNNKLNDDNILPVMLVFPYFLENLVTQNMPKFTMLDYKVDYDNHPFYTTGPKGMKHGSAVRVFVNLPPRLFPLPEGYRFCKSCDKWVYEANNHCDICKRCMSKDGTTYKHCSHCKRCVKPSWLHCFSCTQCYPKDHQCKNIKPKGLCHICHEAGHKRVDCPTRKKDETYQPPLKKQKTVKSKRKT